MVDRPGHVGEQLGVAVGAACDQGPDLDPAGLLGPGGEHCPALEVGAIPCPVQRMEVVPVVDEVESLLLRRVHCVAKPLVSTVLRVELSCDPDPGAAG